MREILDIERQHNQRIGAGGELADSQSLYFTPAGTPLREAAIAAIRRYSGLDQWIINPVVCMTFGSNVSRRVLPVKKINNHSRLQ
jgi:hypothetical protein